MMFFSVLSALIVQWLGHLVVAEKTWVRFPLGAHNTQRDAYLREKDFSFSEGRRSYSYFNENIKSTSFDNNVLVLAHITKCCAR
jgi:hypothetical protein